MVGGVLAGGCGNHGPQLRFIGEVLQDFVALACVGFSGLVCVADLVGTGDGQALALCGGVVDKDDAGAGCEARVEGGEPL